VKQDDHEEHIALHLALEKKRHEWRGEHQEALADILWWIKGRMAASHLMGGSSGFCDVHIEALRRARERLESEVKGD